MPRYIDADKLREVMERYDDYAVDIVDDAPTADVVERKRGKWEMKWDMPCCSVCHKFTALKTPYCGLCGAYMKGEEE